MLEGGTFYNWCLRLLLERVTAWCERRLLADGVELGPIRVCFARRGHDYEHFFSYVDRLRMQKETDTLFLKGPGLAPALLDRTHWTVRAAESVAGLQWRTLSQARSTRQRTAHLPIGTCGRPRSFDLSYRRQAALRRMWASPSGRCPDKPPCLMTAARSSAATATNFKAAGPGLFCIDPAGRSPLLGRPSDRCRFAHGLTAEDAPAYPACLDGNNYSP